MKGRMIMERDDLCSLKWAKELRELGVTQNSAWYWVKDQDDAVVREQMILTGGLPANSNVFSAFTADELGTMLNDFAESGSHANEGSPKYTCWELIYCYAMARKYLSMADASACLLSFIIQEHDFEAAWLITPSFEKDDE